MAIHQHIAAGIDLGSNTFRLLVADCDGENFTVLAKKKATIGLSRGLGKNGLLHENAMQQGFRVLRNFRQTLDDYQPRSMRICGTEALRRARNSVAFLRKAAEIMQQPIDIVSGDEEARLCLAGALSGFPEQLSRPLLLVDVGGGSTELVFVRSPAAEVRAKSIGFGVVGLTEKFFGVSPPDVDRLDSYLTETLHAVLHNQLNFPQEMEVLITGCGGTATSMAALTLNQASYDASRVHGHMLSAAAIEKLWYKLAVLSPIQRNALPCLDHGRGEILPAGIRTYHVLLKLLRQESFRVSDTGLLEGIMLSSINPA